MSQLNQVKEILSNHDVRKILLNNRQNYMNLIKTDEVATCFEEHLYDLLLTSYGYYGYSEHEEVMNEFFTKINSEIILENIEVATKIVIDRIAPYLD